MVDGERSLVVQPDVGTAAWIDCAGHLPWGLSGDQREDDARSLTWDFSPEEGQSQPTIVGQPSVTLDVSASAELASLSVKLCDVFPDGTSALITRGTLDLAGVGPRVELLLDACAYRPDPGHRLRLSVAGADWPNTIAPPGPVTLTVRGGTLTLPLWTDSGVDPPEFVPGAESSAEDSGDVTWSITDDVLRRTTIARTHVVASYDIPGNGTALEDYSGEVGVDRRTFRQWATAETTYRLTWPDVDIRVVSTLRVDIGPDGYDVVIEAEAYDDEDQVGHREWRETVPR
jgi:hypothetical protein